MGLVCVGERHKSPTGLISPESSSLGGKSDLFPSLEAILTFDGIAGRMMCCVGQASPLQRRERETNRKVESPSAWRGAGHSINVTIAACSLRFWPLHTFLKKRTGATSRHVCAFTTACEPVTLGCFYRQDPYICRCYVC